MGGCGFAVNAHTVVHYCEVVLPTREVRTGVDTVGSEGCGQAAGYKGLLSRDWLRDTRTQSLTGAERVRAL